VEAKLADGDITGRLRLACSEETFTPNDQSARLFFDQKNPLNPSQWETPLEPLNAQCSPVPDLETTAAVKSFHAGFAGGLDRLRLPILKTTKTS